MSTILKFKYSALNEHEFTEGSRVLPRGYLHDNSNETRTVAKYRTVFVHLFHVLSCNYK